MSHSPRCPRCDSRAVEELPGFLSGYEGVLETSHRCSVCHSQFKVTPPEKYVETIPEALA